MRELTEVPRVIGLSKRDERGAARHTAAALFARSPISIRSSPSPQDYDPEELLLIALRTGDEAAFTAVVEKHHASMIRVARPYVASAAAAEEVAQDVWLDVLEGIRKFEGRCTLGAWIFSIVANRARRRGEREKRALPLASLPKEPQRPGRWTDEELVFRETLQAVTNAIEVLSPLLRAVITMRLVRGVSSGETCRALGLSETNQRVLLHRARTKVRDALENYLHDGYARNGGRPGQCEARAGPWFRTNGTPNRSLSDSISC